MIAQVLDLDAESIYAVFAQRVRELVGGRTMGLVGVHTGGVWLAERLRKDLNVAAEIGVLDPSFYRDDFAQGGLNPAVRPSRIPFDMAGCHVVLLTSGGVIDGCWPGCSASTLQQLGRRIARLAGVAERALDVTDVPASLTTGCRFVLR